MGEITPYKPKLFDVDTIRGKEYEPYIYSIKFSGKEVKDISAEGYIHAISPFLECLESNLVHMELVPRTEKTSPYFVAVVKVTLHLRFKDGGEEKTLTTDAFGDGDSREAKDPAALVRIVETRAIKRAVARALDLGKKDINKLVNQKDEDMSEDETGTPLEKEYDPDKTKASGSGGKLAQAIKDSRDRVAAFSAEKEKEKEQSEKPAGEPDW